IYICVTLLAYLVFNEYNANKLLPFTIRLSVSSIYVTSCSPSLLYFLIFVRALGDNKVSISSLAITLFYCTNVYPQSVYSSIMYLHSNTQETPLKHSLSLAGALFP